MLSRGLFASFLLLLLHGELLVGAKSSNKPFKIGGPFIKKFRHEGLSRQKRFLDDFFQEFINKAGRNIFSNHHNSYTPYVPDVPQYFPDWSVATNACIVSHNKIVGVVRSIQECQWMCLQESRFICRSVEYEPSSGTCSLSEETSASASTNYVQPCVWWGWLFIERINDWSNPMDACIYSTDKKILVEEVSTLEECKVYCFEETDFVCHSVGYIPWSHTCSLSPETSYSPNFMYPCTISQYTYVERINVPPKSNPCSSDSCGPNSVCWPFGNSFNCTCVDGSTGIPPNCQQHQGCEDQNDCPSNRACVGWTCVDPCVNRCGPNANCQIYNHYPSCTCPANYTGNPYLYCSEIGIETTVAADNQTDTTDEVSTNTTQTEPDVLTTLSPNQTDSTDVVTSTTTEIIDQTSDVVTTPSPKQTDPIDVVTTTTEKMEETTEPTFCDHIGNEDCSDTYVKNMCPTLCGIETTVAAENQTDTTDEASTNTTPTEQDVLTTLSSKQTDSIDAVTSTTTEIIDQTSDPIDVVTTTTEKMEKTTDADYTQPPVTLAEAQTEPTVTETSIIEVTDALEGEITTVIPVVRRRNPRLEEENIV